MVYYMLFLCLCLPCPIVTTSFFFLILPSAILPLAAGMNNLCLEFSHYLGHTSATVEPRSIYNEVLNIKNDFLYPINSKIYDKETQCNETLLQKTNFFQSLGPSIIEVPLYFKRKKNMYIYKLITESRVFPAAIDK